MMRLLIFAALAYVAFRVMKAWVFPSGGPRPPLGGTTREQIDDVMVMDPYCRVYFPKREGIEARVAGETLFFCSTECRDRFLAEKSH